MARCLTSTKHYLNLKLLTSHLLLMRSFYVRVKAIFTGNTHAVSHVMDFSKLYIQNHYHISHGTMSWVKQRNSLAELNLSVQHVWIQCSVKIMITDRKGMIQVGVPCRRSLFSLNCVHRMYIYAFLKGHKTSLNFTNGLSRLALVVKGLLKRTFS